MTDRSRPASPEPRCAAIPHCLPDLVAHPARSQWTIENRRRFVRDTTFTEDASTIRTRHGPESMATLRNLAVGTLRRAGNRSIAAGPHEVSSTPHTRPLDLLRLP